MCYSTCYQCCEVRYEHNSGWTADSLRNDELLAEGTPAKSFLFHHILCLGCSWQNEKGLAGKTARKFTEYPDLAGNVKKFSQTGGRNPKINLIESNLMFANTIQYSLCAQGLKSHQGSSLLPQLPTCAQVRIPALSIIMYKQAAETRLVMEVGIFQRACLNAVFIMFGLLFQNLSLCEMRCRCTGRAISKADCLNNLDKVSIHSS